MTGAQDQDLPATPNVKLSIAPNGMILTKHDPSDENNIEVRAWHVLT